MSSALLCSLCACSGQPNDTYTTDPSTLTFDDLRDAAASTEWLSYGHDFENSRFAPLKEVNTQNVAALAPGYLVQTGLAAGFEDSPLASNGILYVSTPFDQVMAIDARTGREIWRYRPRLRSATLCCGPTNRGVAVAEGLVFIGRLDATLVALDQDSGQVVWQTKVADPASHYSITMAPIVYQDEVLVGVAGGEFGIRGFIAAFALDDGRERWRWYSTDDHSWRDSFSPRTPLGEDLHRDLAAERHKFPRSASAWRRGGGAIWSTPAIDVDRKTVYLSTGNPWPGDGEQRPGDNRNTDSIVALDDGTGRLRWAFQEVPHDLWDDDAASPPFLFTTRGPDDRPIASVGEVGKTGWLYILNRDTGALIGHAVAVDAPADEQPPVTGEPGTGGRTTWSPVAVERDLNVAIIVGNHFGEGHRRRHHRRRDTATDLDEIGTGYGLVTCVDLTRRTILWQNRVADGVVGGALATAGGLDFVGESSGYIDAFAADTGRLLWHFQLGAGVNAPPVAFAAGGNEYVAVAAGGNTQAHSAIGDTLAVFHLPHQ